MEATGLAYLSLAAAREFGIDLDDEADAAVEDFLTSPAQVPRSSALPNNLLCSAWLRLLGHHPHPFTMRSLCTRPRHRYKSVCTSQAGACARAGRLCPTIASIPSGQGRLGASQIVCVMMFQGRDDSPEMSCMQHKEHDLPGQSSKPQKALAL